VVLALGAGAYYLSVQPTITVRPSTTTIPVVTTIDAGVTTSVPVPTTQPMGTLRVDALPWATVTIRALSQGVQLESTEYVTPFSTALPAGDYELRFNNPQYKAPDVAKVKIAPDKPVDVRVTMRGFDPDKALDSILAEPGR
jgi:hypothetical protein